MADRKLKVLYIAPRFYPYRAGAEGNLLAMAERMAELGYDVSVFTSDVKFRDKKPPKYEDYRNIKIYRFRTFIEAPVYLCFIPGLLIKLLRTNPDVIHVSGFGFIWIEFCLSIKKLSLKIKNFFGKLIKKDKYVPTKLKLINTPHGPFMAFSYGKEESKIRKFSRNIYTWYLKKIIPWMYDKVIAVVPKQKEWMTKLYNINESKIETIPNGIEERYLEESIHKFKKSDKVVISYLNRMEWYKGVQTVLKAIDKLNRQEKYRESRKDLKSKPLPKYEFIIMGRPTSYTNTLRDMITKFNIEDKIKFVFTPTDEDRDEIFYEKSQINILPSKWEATGIVLIEAMAKGNALITTYQNEGWDLVVKEGENGFVYEFGDVEHLTKILRKLLEDYELRQKMRQASFEYSKNFTWEAVFPKYEKMVLEICS